MDTPLEYFFGGAFEQSLGEAAEKCHPLEGESMVRYFKSGI
jgi:hypothetical protein